MELVKTFRELGRNDAATAGGKGASLGEMTQAGIPVPPGFVVLADAFERFLHETDVAQEIDAILATVNHEAMHTVDHASETIRGLIESREMPADIRMSIEAEYKALGAEFVAVRSSATAEDGAEHAWAGQLESYLNVTETDVLARVQTCWASLFTPRAIFYRFEKGLHATKISVAVVVQSMVNSEKSGIAFSVHPVTEDYNQLIIEAGLGLGEAIVSGSVTPDSYVVEKEPLRVVDVNVSEQSKALYRKVGGGNEWKTLTASVANAQVLSGTDIVELSEIVKRIEHHYGHPQDIEWAYEAGKFYIVQSRPITTLRPRSSESEKPSDDFSPSVGLDRTSDWNEQGRWVFTPFISSSMMHHFMVSEPAQQILPGVSLSSYFVVDYYAFQLKSEKQAIFNFAKLNFDNGTLGEVARRIDTLGEKVIGALKNHLEKDETYRRTHAATILKAYRDLNDFWLVQSYLGDLCMDLAKAVGYVRNEQELFGKVQPFLRDSWIERELKDAVAIAKYCIESLGLEIVTPEHVAADAKLGALVAEYCNVYSWSKISWWMGETLTLAQALERANQEIRNIKEGNHIETHRSDDTSGIDDIVLLSVSSSYWRTDCGMMIMMAGEKLSFIFDDIAKENGINKEDALLLTFLEVLSLAEQNETRIPDLNAVLKRKGEYFAIGDNKGGLIVFGPDDARYKPIRDRFVSAPPAAATDTLSGLAACPGKVTGRVHVVQTAAEFESFKDGEILVSTETSPMFVPLMRKASAILTGKGGITSHAAIVSRELKKPCIIAIKDVVKILKTGDMVEVDADTGVIRIIKKNIEERFHHQYTQSGMGVLFASCILGDDSYAPALYVQIAEHNELRGYLPSEGLSIARTIGNDLLDPRLYEELSHEGSRIESDLLSYEPPELNAMNAKSEWQRLLTLIRRMCRIYRYSDEGFIQGLSEYLQTKFSDEEIGTLVHGDKPLEKMDGNARQIVTALRTMGALRLRLHQNAETLATKGLSTFYAYLKELHGLSPEECEALTAEEMEAALQGSEPPRGTLRERLKGAVIFPENGTYIVGTGSVFQEWKARVERSMPAEIRGNVAVTGKVTGRAVRHLSWTDVTPLPPGSILITGMTNPQMVPYLKSAAAIVTDEGGVACHAAIISREMGIPCIVGTQIATQMIKTGDLVEVDAFRGIVTLKNVEKLTSKDFYLMFQATGTTLLFSDICLQYYNNLNCVITLKDDQYRYYPNLKEHEPNRRRYKEYYGDFDNIERAAQKVKGVVKELRELEKDVVDRPLTNADFRRFIELSGIAMFEYSKFDHLFTDFLFEDTRTDIGKFIEAVAREKNDLREYVNAVFFNADSSLVFLVKKLGEQFGIPESQLHYASVEQLAKLVDTGVFEPKGENGDDYALVRDDDGNITIYTGREATEFIDSFIVDDDISKATALEGISVSKKGVYTGEVRKVTVDYSNYNESIAAHASVPADCILVTESTVPEMLPVMSRSKAIITDMGGMLSHASITSRELGIPCIIGTKFATEVLKDGDMVEVDADVGVVRMLETTLSPTGSRTPYTKMFTRDFTLPSLEAWYRGEVKLEKQWTNWSQTHLPYIVFARKEGTTTAYYNEAGIREVQNRLITKAFEDPSFIPLIEATIPKKLDFIIRVCKEGKAIGRADLLKFIDDIEKFFVWFEAMWWLLGASDSDTVGLDLSGLRKLREDTNELSAETSNIIRASLMKLYPELGEDAALLTVLEISSNTPPSREELARRAQGFVFTDDKLFVGITRADIEERFNIELEAVDTNAYNGVLIGATAERGKVTGRGARNDSWRRNTA